MQDKEMHSRLVRVASQLDYRWVQIDIEGRKIECTIVVEHDITIFRMSSYLIRCFHCRFYTFCHDVQDLLNIGVCQLLLYFQTVKNTLLE